ncbi:MAG: hypothetical protein R2856_21205 [Caldilineaceae bacterium]
MLSGNSGVGNQYNGLQVDGTITGTVTWDGDNAFPFLVNGDLTVNEGAQLTLTPGTVMKFRNSTDELWVNGTLIADASGTGTRPSSSPRTSTTLWAATPTTTAATPPLRPTIGVRSASRQAAAAACWTTSSCATAATGTTKTSTSPPAVTLRNSTISHSGEYGIQFENTLPASLTNLRFENNGLAAYADLENNADSVVLSGNSGVGNQYNGLQVDGTITERSHGTGTTPSPSSSTVT